jgi:uncharacterized protein YdiU (UPF0061 family)
MITTDLTTGDSIYNGWHLDHSYANLPPILYTRTNPVRVFNPRIIVFNNPLSDSLGLNTIHLATEGAAILSGNLLCPGALPIAQAYAGHQFGHFTLLGDGRAILIGEQITPAGERFDIQLKGAGPTPYSRRGDGRAALGPMLREYVMSEALHALGIPTTRSLAVTTTGEPVFREAVLPGAVLTRVAASHIRVGTFEFVALQKQYDLLRAIADYTIKRHYPWLEDVNNPYALFLRATIDLQAALVAKWQLYGFIHGVMNTDNMALSGETIDYGPCAFMDEFDPVTVFSSIDVQGRYSYANQPLLAKWNLTRFAETLLPLLDANQEHAIKIAEMELRTFDERFRHYWMSGMLAKLGFRSPEGVDVTLIESLLNWMKQSQMDYTNTFRDLSSGGFPEAAVYQSPVFKHWYNQWQEQLIRQGQPWDKIYARMRSCNPAVIPRNHRVEEALAAAVENEDLSVLERLLRVLRTPFNVSSEDGEYALPPPGGRGEYRTFCGT